MLSMSTLLHGTYLISLSVRLVPCNEMPSDSSANVSLLPSATPRLHVVWNALSSVQRRIEPPEDDFIERQLRTFEMDLSYTTSMTQRSRCCVGRAMKEERADMTTDLAAAFRK